MNYEAFDGTLSRVRPQGGQHSIYQLNIVGAGTVSGDGGCIWLGANNKLEIWDSTFLSCACTGNGGAIYMESLSYIILSTAYIGGCAAGGVSVCCLAAFA